VVMWLDGYYADEDDPPVVDFVVREELAGH
jgi:hypothetical protein